MTTVAHARPSTAPPAGSFSRRQQLFIRYTFSVLVDLTVLNIFNEYWDHVVLTSFTASLLAAALLQALLKITLNLEHRIAEHFAEKPSPGARAMRILSAFAVLFGSKFIMLGAIHLTFGERVQFLGHMHGAFAFIAVVLTMLIADGTIRRIYLSLA